MHKFINGSSNVSKIQQVSTKTKVIQQYSNLRNVTVSKLKGQRSASDVLASIHEMSMNQSAPKGS